METIIAQRYARAFFELSQEKEQEEVFLKESMWIRTVFEQHPELMNFLSAPEIPAEEKEIAVRNIFAAECGRESLGLICLLIRKGRIRLLGSILKEYEKLAREARREITVQVRSAAKLSTAQLEKLREILEKKLDRTVSLSVKVDPSLIGGLIVRVVDQLYDNSIRSRMEKLRAHLSGISLSGTEKVG